MCQDSLGTMDHGPGTRAPSAAAAARSRDGGCQGQQNSQMASSAHVKHETLQPSECLRVVQHERCCQVTSTQEVSLGDRAPGKSDGGSLRVSDTLCALQGRCSFKSPAVRQACAVWTSRASGASGPSPSLAPDSARQEVAWPAQEVMQRSSVAVVAMRTNES